MQEKVQNFVKQTTELSVKISVGRALLIQLNSIKLFICLHSYSTALRSIAYSY
jgi:hypothetical protein